MKAAASVPVPSGVVTVTLTAPADPGGDQAVMDVAELTVTLVAVLGPNLTALSPTKPVPVMVTTVFPPTGRGRV